MARKAETICEGRLAAVLNSSGGWERGEVYADGRQVATYVNNNTYFTNGDWLGTARVRTDSSGALSTTCQGLPYGNGQICSGTDVSPLHFTGKQYDSESGLDYFGARYYEESLGRFMTPDWSAKAEPVPYAKLDNPQTLNLYIYATDNPTTLTDPTGHMAPGSSGPLTLTGPFTDGANVGWPFAMPWDWATYHPVVVLRNPKVSQKAVNDAKKAQKKVQEHSVQEVAGANQRSHDKSSGISGHAQVLYAKAQNTSGHGKVGFKAGVGAGNFTLSGKGGLINEQSFTANAEGHAGTGGIGAGASARVVKFGAALSFQAGPYTVTVRDSVSLIGVGAHVDVNWSHGLSIDAGLIAGALGDSIGLSVTEGP